MNDDYFVIICSIFKLKMQKHNIIKDIVSVVFKMFMLHNRSISMSAKTSTFQLM